MSSLPGRGPVTLLTTQMSRPHPRSEGVHSLSDLEHFKIENLWAAELEEKREETDQNFLFCADVEARGTQVLGHHIVFENVIYDIQSCEYDFVDGVELKFEIKFGSNTEERKDVPKGWYVIFEELVASHNEEGHRKYHGHVHVSWWGGARRRVILHKYLDLSHHEHHKFPGLDAKHHDKSFPTEEEASIAVK